MPQYESDQLPIAMEAAIDIIDVDAHEISNGHTLKRNWKLDDFQKLRASGPRAPCHDPRWPAATVAGSVGALRANQGIAGVIQIWAI